MGEEHWVTLLSQGLQRETAAHLHPEIIPSKVRAFQAGCISCNLGKSSCLPNQCAGPAQQVVNTRLHLLLLSSSRSSPKPATKSSPPQWHFSPGSLALLLQPRRPRLVATRCEAEEGDLCWVKGGCRWGRKEETMLGQKGDEPLRALSSGRTGWDAVLG